MYKLLYLRVIFKISNDQLKGTNPWEPWDADRWASLGTPARRCTRALGQPRSQPGMYRETSFSQKCLGNINFRVSLAYLSPSCYFLHHLRFISQKSNPTCKADNSLLGVTKWFQIISNIT